LLVTASAVPSSPILVTLMMEAPSSSGTSVLTRATRRNIPEDVSLHGTSESDTFEYATTVSMHIRSSIYLLFVFALMSVLCLKSVSGAIAVFSACL
jgi:hypothetical protein